MGLGSLFNAGDLNQLRWSSRNASAAPSSAGAGSASSSGSGPSTDLKHGTSCGSTTTTCSRDKNPPPQPQQPSQSLEYLTDESQLPPPEPDPPDLRELNAALEALAAVFPDVRAEVFREMLTNFDGESRLALVADALLKNRAKWVRGRWRVPEKEEEAEPAAAVEEDEKHENGEKDDSDAVRHPRPLHEGDGSSTSRQRRLVPVSETFRSEDYKKAVRALAWHEFKGLRRSTIDAVLAESNYSYLAARQTLVDLSLKSWRFAISSFIFRRKSPVPLPSDGGTLSGDAPTESLPLVIWKSTGKGSLMPALRSTGNAELDRELFSALVSPLLRRDRLAAAARDRKLARELNVSEAEAAGAELECRCCFSTYPFEEFTACTSSGADGDDDNDEPHLVCLVCVRRCVEEAVFGQGWRRNVDAEKGTLRCPAVADGCGPDGCPGLIPYDLLRRAVLESSDDGARGGAETLLHRLDQRLAEHSLVASGLPLVRCPFCSYAEVDDLYVPPEQEALRLRRDGLWPLFLILVILVGLAFAVPVLCLASIAALLGLINQHATSEVQRQRQQQKPVAGSSQGSILLSGSLGTWLYNEWNAAINRLRRRRRGLKFTCRNPSCGRSSCLGCSRAWRDIHVCRETALVALRTQVEMAMSLAIKRVCPRCNTSFVKTAGCNKLTCPCGYKMCYVCRRDIGGSSDGGEGEGYRHFCDHFRPEGDPKPCTQCRKCNLWESEDEEAVLRKAREDAERRWLETEKRALTGAEKAFLATGFDGGTPSDAVVAPGGVAPAPAAEKAGIGAPFDVSSALGIVHSETWAAVRSARRAPTVQEMFDIVVETIYI